MSKEDAIGQYCATLDCSGEIVAVREGVIERHGYTGLMTIYVVETQWGRLDVPECDLVSWAIGTPLEVGLSLGFALTQIGLRAMAPATQREGQ